MQGWRCVPIWLGLSALGLPACGAAGEDTSSLGDFESDAPTVVDTFPRDGAADVEPTLFVLSATFSESMQTNGWSWVTETGREAPEVTGSPFYVDDTTNLLPVRLEARTTYVVWVNSPDDVSLRKFSSTSGVAARAHRIRFTTR